MLELNLVEICCVALWCAGVVAAIAARPVNGIGPRYFAVVATAVMVPFLGTVISFLNFGMVRGDHRRAPTSDGASQSESCAVTHS